MIRLGVDIGGTGAKCVAFRDDGNQLAISYMEYPNPPGKANLEAEILWSSVMNVIRNCVDQLQDKEDVVAITVSSFGESFVPVDRDGNALADIIMYFSDSSSEEFRKLIAEIGEEKFMRIARIKPDASYSLAKMLYTRSIPKTPIWKFFLIAGYICFKLGSVPATDASLASRTLLFDVEKKCWSQELLQAADLDESLMPDIFEAGSIIGQLKADIAQALHLNTNVQVVIGSHDQIVNALACGVCEPGDAMDGSGTTECIEPLLAAIPEDLNFTQENYACVPYLDGRGYVTYAYNISGGMVVKWYRDKLAKHFLQQAKDENTSIYDILNRVCPVEPGKLIVLPFLQGMGNTPDIQTEARGVFWGVSMDTGLPELYRAILEGLSFEMEYNLERLGHYGVAPKRLYACGGGSKSKVWLQIKSDIWNCEIIPVLTEETGALGSAILGFAAVMGERDRCALAKRFVRIGKPVQPNPAHVQLYREKYREYKKLRSYMLDSLKN